MKEILIEELAYLIKGAYNQGAPQPIFFLGAGASVTGNIPLARDISKKIVEDHASNPFVRKLQPEQQKYSKLMGCLQPAERTDIMKRYIDEAKINVTHIYLAQLIKEGYADYVLTVNFDNLMLRALALYNIFPPTYDLAILKDLTTTTFNEASVIYLHGKYNGTRILNTEDEMERAGPIVQRIFDSIKNKRPWIFIGYSGSDPIFNYVKNLGTFDNGLYWVGYNDHLPKQEVQDFLTDPITNASFINGFDSDAFMLKLNKELGLPQPEILSKPFSLLNGMLHEINDINDEEHFKGVKERLSMAISNVSDAIKRYEEKNFDDSTSDENLKIQRLQEEIIKIMISEEYNKEEIVGIEKRMADYEDTTANGLLASLYFNWGTDLGKLAETKSGVKADELYQLAFEKFQKANLIYIMPVTIGGMPWENSLKQKQERKQRNFMRWPLKNFKKQLKSSPINMRLTTIGGLTSES